LSLVSEKIEGLLDSYSKRIIADNSVFTQIIEITIKTMGVESAKMALLKLGYQPLRQFAGIEQLDSDTQLQLQETSITMISFLEL
jgi:hypothetical protein